MSGKDLRILELERALQECQRDSRVKDERIQLLEDKVDDYEHRCRDQIAKIKDCEKTLAKYEESAMDFQDQFENLAQQQQSVFEYLLSRLDRMNFRFHVANCQSIWVYFINLLTAISYFLILLVYYLQRRDQPEH